MSEADLPPLPEGVSADDLTPEGFVDWHADPIEPPSYVQHVTPYREWLVSAEVGGWHLDADMSAAEQSVQDIRNTYARRGMDLTQPDELVRLYFDFHVVFSFITAEKGNCTPTAESLAHLSFHLNNPCLAYLKVLDVLATEVWGPYQPQEIQP